MKPPLGDVGDVDLEYSITNVFFLKKGTFKDIYFI